MLKNGISILLFVAFAMAEAPIKGQVLSSKGNPLAYAVIIDGAHKNWVIADDNGQFYYHSAGIGDILHISRYGYHSDSLTISDKSFYTIALQPQPIKQGSVIVSGDDQNFQGQIINTYRSDIGINNPLNAIQQIPGITIRSYGGKAGILNLSTDGSPSVNTKILLDDIDISSAQNGETDLSQIPEILINQITVANAPGIFYGSGAVDGVLRISPQYYQTDFSASMGSFGFSSFSGNIHNKWSKWSANLSAGYLKDDGDFTYSIEDTTHSRLNNGFNRKYITIRTTGRLSEKSNLSALLLESQQERGVAGSIDWPSQEAKRDDKLRLAAVKYNLLHKNGYSKVQFNYRKSVENYDDPNPLWSIKSEHNVLGTSFKFQHHRNVWNNTTGTFLYEGKLEKLESTDVGDHSRNTNSLATVLNILFLDNFTAAPAIRLDRIGNSDIQPTMDLRLRYNNMKGTEVEYHFGTGFRNPSFNDLYWPQSGNPDLEPEDSKYQSIKFKLSLANNPLSSIYLNITDRHTTDLIQWAPISEGLFVWQPQNIATSRRTKFTIGSQYTCQLLPMQFAVHATYQKTKDIDLNKPLLYASEIIGYAGINYNANPLNIALSAHYTGERIVAYPSFSNPDDSLLPAYIYTNAAFQYQLPILSDQLSILLNVNNILDKQFESIRGYPEPGRTIRFGLKYIFLYK